MTVYDLAAIVGTAGFIAICAVVFVLLLDLILDGSYDRKD